MQFINKNPTYSQEGKVFILCLSSDTLIFQFLGVFPAMKKDAIVLLEGIDGCGKDTQIALLREKLAFTHFKYPTSSFPPIWEYLEKKRTIEPRALFLLFLSDIANEQGKLSAAEGMRVIDRYATSTIAYDRAFSLEDAKAIVEKASLIKPDLVILLDLPPKTAISRKSRQKEGEGKSPDRYDEDLEYLEHVRGRFLKLRDDSFLCRKWVVLDAQKPAGEVHTKILSLLESM